jgi:hypothetical protein
MRHELWDLESGNLLGCYASEIEGFRDVLALVQVNDAPVAASLSFGPVVVERERLGIAPPSPLQGRELIDRAESALAAHA